LEVSEINSIVVKHGRATAPDVKIIARHFGHLIWPTNALCAKLIRVRKSTYPRNLLLHCDNTAAD